MIKLFAKFWETFGKSWSSKNINQLDVDESENESNN